MTRKSPKRFLDAKSCVESVSEVFFEVPARPDELGTLLLARDSRNRTLLLMLTPLLTETTPSVTVFVTRAPWLTLRQRQSAGGERGGDLRP